MPSHKLPATAAEARALELARMTEAQFFEQVRELVKLTHWRMYHAYDSRRSYEGWPDVVLLRKKEGQTRMVIMELKTERGKVTLSQQETLELLTEVRKMEVLGVVRPSDWEMLVKVLT